MTLKRQLHNLLKIQWGADMIEEREVEKLVKLARLKVDKDQRESLAKHLDQAISYFNEISKIDTTGIEPLITPSDIEPILRADYSEHSISTDELLKNAPERSGNLFKVPPVVG